MQVDKNSGDASHEGDVTCVCVHKDHVYSAGADGKIKVFLEFSSRWEYSWSSDVFIIEIMQVWDLNLKLVKEINIHEAYIYSIAVDKNGRLYSSSCDGFIKFIDNPLQSDDAKVLLHHDTEIEAIFVDDDAKFYSGDSKGGVTCFEDGKLKFQMNIVECVKSLFVEGKYVYTLLNLDLSIHEVRDSGNYSMTASIPGKFPVTLFGDRIEARSNYIAILTRDGRGVTIIGNAVKDKFAKILCKENMHEMIVNTMKGCNDVLFTGDYAGKIVKSKMIGRDELKEIATGCTESGCANSIAVLDENTIFVGSTDGSVKKVTFN